MRQRNEEIVSYQFGVNITSRITHDIHHTHTKFNLISSFKKFLLSFFVGMSINGSELREK